MATTDQDDDEALAVEARAIDEEQAWLDYDAEQIAETRAAHDALEAKFEHAVEMAKRYRHHNGDARFWMPWSAYGAPLEHQAAERQQTLLKCATSGVAHPEVELDQQIGDDDSDEAMPHAPLRRMYRIAHALREPAARAVKAVEKAHKGRCAALTARREKHKAKRERAAAKAARRGRR